MASESSGGLDGKSSVQSLGDKAGAGSAHASAGLPPQVLLQLNTVRIKMRDVRNALEDKMERTFSSKKAIVGKVNPHPIIPEILNRKPLILNPKP